METKKPVFCENVIIIDVYFLNLLVKDMRNHFEKKLARKLDDTDIPCLLDFISLDMGMKIGNQNKVLVIWVNDSDCTELDNANMSNVEKDLNGKAFDDKVGNFEMIAAPCKEMVSRKDLMLNLIELLADADEVKRIGVLPDCLEFEEDIFHALDKIANKETHLFTVDKDKFKANNSNIQSILFPVLAGMNIQGNELE